jgi:hypothetical protein
MSMSDDVVIVSAARTPVGTFNGAFANTPPMIWARWPSRLRLSGPVSSRRACPK